MFETKPWKESGCTLNLNTSKLSDRETFSKEINDEYGEGGGLNANYRTVEAIAIATNVLGKHNLLYKKDFIFKTISVDGFTLDFSNKKTRVRGARALRNFLK